MESVRTLKSIPLHGVLRGDLTELSFDNVGDLGVAQVVVVDLRAEVGLSLGLELAIKTRSSVAIAIAASLRRGLAGGSAGCWRRVVAVAAAAARNTLRVPVTAFGQSPKSDFWRVWNLLHEGAGRAGDASLRAGVGLATA